MVDVTPVKRSIDSAPMYEWTTKARAIQNSMEGTNTEGLICTWYEFLVKSRKLIPIFRVAFKLPRKKKKNVKGK